MNKTREQIIHSMCMTWQHDYGLLTEHERNVMFRRMAQIFDHEIVSELMMQSDCDNYEEEAEEMRDKIDSLEQRNAELEQRVKELEEPKTCKSCKHFMSNHSFRLGHSDYLNGCKVLITTSDFSCSDYEPKDTKCN